MPPCPPVMPLWPAQLGISARVRQPAPPDCRRSRVADGRIGMRLEGGGGAAKVRWVVWRRGHGVGWGLKFPEGRRAHWHEGGGGAAVGEVAAGHGVGCAVAQQPRRRLRPRRVPRPQHVEQRRCHLRHVHQSPAPPAHRFPYSEKCCIRKILRLNQRPLRCLKSHMLCMTLSVTPRNRLSMRLLTHCSTAMQSKLVRKAQAEGGGQRSHACRAACAPPRFAGTPTFLPRKIDASNMRAGRQAVQAIACLRGRLRAGSKRGFFRGRGCRVSQQPAHRESGHGCNGRPPGGGSRCDDLGESLRRCGAPRGHGAVQQLRKALHAACAAPQARNSAHRTDGPAGGGVAQARHHSAHLDACHGTRSVTAPPRRRRRRRCAERPAA